MDTAIVKHTFDFENSSIRVIGDQDKPWFVAKDICKILGLSNVSQSTKSVPDKWKGIQSFYTPYGNQEMIVLAEPALWKLVMRSTKKDAQKFQEWIFEEVIPSIRKTGEYKMKTALEAKNKEIEDLNRLLRRKLRKTHNKGNSVYVVKNPDINDKFKLGCTKDIDRRLQDYGGASPHEYELLYHRHIEPMKQVEDIVLFILDPYRCQSNFKGSKKREWLEIDSDVITSELDELCTYIIERRKLYDVDYEERPKVVQSEEKDEGSYTKTCVSCSEEKEIGEFYDRPDNVDGVEGVCKHCYVQRQLRAREERRIKLLGNRKKKCRKCKLTQHLSMYQPHPTSKDGYTYICHNCRKKPMLFRTEKVCSCCKETKPVEDYNNCRTASDGKFAYCRPCTKIKNAKYKAKIRSK